MHENKSIKYYTKEHLRAINSANTYEELLEVALDVLRNFPKPVIMVCGPISTGGLGNIKANLKHYEKIIDKLVSKGNNVFTQMPFEKTLQVLKEKIGKTPQERSKMLLDKFYLPIYESRLIDKMYFIYGWESSHGARWEREIAKKLGIEIEDLDKDYLEK